MALFTVSTSALSAEARPSKAAAARHPPKAGPSTLVITAFFTATLTA